LAQSRSEIIAWVGSNIVPHEGGLRAWLRRMALPEDEINDIVQDAYVSIARLDSVAQIRMAASNQPNIGRPPPRPSGDNFSASPLADGQVALIHAARQLRSKCCEHCLGELLLAVRIAW
jgi:hypothetical protein